MGSSYPRSQKRDLGHPATGIKVDQIIQEGTWVHISFAPAMRNEVLTAHFTADGAKYEKGVTNS